MNLQTLLTGWNFMRWLRLILGLTISFQAIQSHDMMLGFIAVVFLFQTATNTGCCGSGGCQVPSSKPMNQKTEDVEFEEIK